jgi:hypothetical protein
LENLGPSPQTVFRAAIDARMIDLTEAPFNRAHSEWTNPRDYAATQRFARLARQADIEAIRYESVRDPLHAGAVAVLRPCFKPRKPLEQHIWLLTVRRDAAIWQRDGDSHEFAASEWPK